ncbi:MAG: hypothetical protein LBL65_07985 [Campylobacteraceae bacterium]|jgi:hypothetical protein|nr:hypothetical protein [Campylobacteraceae bacterium]
MFRKISALLILTVCVLSAHKINLFMYDDNGTLYIQSYFTKSSPCKNCEVVVKDENAKDIVRLLTDDEGKTSVQMSNDAVIVSVDGGMGHFKETKYILKSLTKEDTQNLPSDIPLPNLFIALVIMAGIFSVLWFVKKKK